MSEQKLILVADSREESLILFHQILQRHGYDVVLAASADEAMAQAQKHLPDLILMDPCMAGGEGLSLARRLRDAERTAGIPIAALSAGETDLERALGEAGFCAVVPKRVPLRALLEAVRRCLGGGGWTDFAGAAPMPA